MRIGIKKTYNTILSKHSRLSRHQGSCGRQSKQDEACPGDGVLRKRQQGNDVALQRLFWGCTQQKEREKIRNTFECEY